MSPNLKHFINSKGKKRLIHAFCKEISNFRGLDVIWTWYAGSIVHEGCANTAHTLSYLLSVDYAWHTATNVGHLEILEIINLAVSDRWY